MPKAKYTPPSADVAARIEAVVHLYRRQQEIEAEYKRALAQVAAEDDVPVSHLAEQLGLTRKTVYRHLGRSMT